MQTVWLTVKVQTFGKLRHGQEMGPRVDRILRTKMHIAEGSELLDVVVDSIDSGGAVALKS